MAFHVSFFFEQRGDLSSGYTENFWNLLTSDTALEAAAVKLRGALLTAKGWGISCPKIRISDASNFRELQILRYPQGSGAKGLPEDADFVNTGVQLILTALPKYKTIQWFRSIPDNSVARAGRYQPSAQFLTDIGKLFGLLTNGANGWCLRKQNRANEKKDIVSISQAGVVTSPGHGFVNFDQVRVSRCKGTFVVNKIWKVTRLDTDTFQLVGFQTPTPAAIYLGGGKATAQTPVFVAINKAVTGRATSHKTGRPFDQSSGKATSKRT